MADGARSRILALGLASERLLAQFGVRLVLSIAIIASLLPHPWLEGLAPAFLGLFLAEFVLRLLAVVVTTRAQATVVFDEGEVPIDPATPRSRRAALTLLLLDGLALVSFVPLGAIADARWLRLFRLTRMLVLFGYWAPLWGDLMVVLARRERLRQVVLMGAVVSGLSLAGALVLHHATDLPFDADENGVVDRGDQGFFVLLWWAFRQVQDPGNMLESPMALPAVIVSLALTVAGLFLVSFLIGMGSDIVRELIEIGHTRSPGLRGHTVLVNITPSTRRLLHELRCYYRKLWPTSSRILSRQWLTDLRHRGVRRQEYVVVGREDHPPEFLRTAELANVVYRARPVDEEDLLARADLVTAKRVLLLADGHEADPDAETVRLLVSLVERVRARERFLAEHDLGPRRTRVVIAEILDESNLGAAQAALATAGTSFRGFVVPTEKLLGLFFAGVVRRPGLGRLLTELLTSDGHEIYTCFFDTPGLGFQVPRPRGLDGAAGPLLRGLFALGQDGAAAHPTIVPVGLLLDAPRRDSPRDFRVAINPPVGMPVVAEQVRGVIALADSFASVRAWQDRWRAHGLPRDVVPGPAVALPDLHRTRRAKTTRVLVCGFRAGTIYMLEELFRSDPMGEVLVLVHDETTLRRALAAIDGHTQLVVRGLMGGRHGTFTLVGPGELAVRMPETATIASRMRIEVADWMASRNLVDLPAGFGHVASVDAVVFVSGDGDASDPRTTTALLKLEQLCVVPDREPPLVVAEVFDDKLAARLCARARKLGHDHVKVYSIQELRAFFLFQSVVVPGFDLVYEELLGAWGQSIVHKHVGERRTGRCTFVALARALAEGGELLLALELADADGRVELVVAPRESDRGAVFALDRLQGCWVVAADSGDPLPLAEVEIATAATP